MKSISQEKLQVLYFGTLFIIFGILSLTILSNFLIVLGLAYVCAVLVFPMYEKIAVQLRKTMWVKNFASSISALCTILLLVLLIITPVTLLLGKVLTDAQGFYTYVTTSGVHLDVISLRIQHQLAVYIPNIQQNISTGATAISGFFVKNIGTFFSGTIDLVLKIFLFMLALFYFLKDKTYFVDMYKKLSPLTPGDDSRIFESIQSAVRSIVLGSIVVALAQGAMTGIGFAIFGVPNPFFFGSIAGLLSLIPGVGATLVWLSGAVYLYITTGDYSFMWLGQVIWGVVAVGLIDNILGPLVINKGVQIHPLFILLSVIGGISVFGPEGFLFGPLVLSIFVAIATVWQAKTESI